MDIQTNSKATLKKQIQNYRVRGVLSKWIRINLNSAFYTWQKASDHKSNLERCQAQLQKERKEAVFSLFFHSTSVLLHAAFNTT